MLVLDKFPFDKYQIGALSVEHNFQEPKSSEIKAMMERHGYTRVHTSDRAFSALPHSLPTWGEHL
jgi:hypothetical protein